MDTHYMFVVRMKEPTLKDKVGAVVPWSTQNALIHTPPENSTYDGLYKWLECLNPQELAW